jgi:hypothetical protein
MIYILDSSMLIDLFRNYYLDRFPSLWVLFDRLVNDGKGVSVREVFNEVKDRKDRLSEWSHRNHDFFRLPSEEELMFVSEIFRVKHFQSMIREQERLQGKPVADPFIIAYAKCNGGCVVTQEAAKPNSSKMPVVCTRYKIPCMSLEEFMKNENWTF